MHWSGLLDLVEAGVGSGQADKLVDMIAELEGIAARSESPFLRAELLCARPVLAGDHEAEAFFAAALGQDLTAHPFLQARTLFSFGRWLRRRRRATGETIGRRTPDARDRLTAQELQVAHLAAEGLSNREVGERVFLSHRTVGGHLYRIFPKLGITGRAQLRNALK